MRTFKEYWAAIEPEKKVITLARMRIRNKERWQTMDPEKKQMLLDRMKAYTKEWNAKKAAEASLSSGTGDVRL